MAQQNPDASKVQAARTKLEGCLADQKQAQNDANFLVDAFADILTIGTLMQQATAAHRFGIASEKLEQAMRATRTAAREFIEASSYRKG